MEKTQPVNKKMCATCPWRKGSPYEHLRGYLETASLKTSRICHSTGKGNAINEGDTGLPERLCRGSRNFQLGFFHQIGFLKKPTDKCWDQKWESLVRKK